MFKRILRFLPSVFFATIFAVFCYVPAYACELEEIFVQGECQMPKFSVQLQYDEEGGGDFGFELNATGDFFVDWGDGNTEEIHRDMESASEYQHNYENGGSYTIKFAGLATGYPNDDEMPAIKFGQRPGHDHIVGISGNLISIFPVFDPGDSTMSPGFRETFSDCHNLTEIPANLFGGAEGTILGGRPYMFANTFANSGVTFIPSHLFAGITSAQDHIFESVFANNQQMTGFIPESAFQGWVNANFPSSPEGMWGGAFGGTQLDTSCPDGINQVITGFEDDWGGYVMCSGENSTGSGGGGGDDEPVVCPDAYYNDGGECMPCPSGYEYNPHPANITECQVQCPEGTWVDQPDVSNINGGYTRLEYLESKGGQYINTGHRHLSSNIHGVIRIGTNVDITSNINIIGNQGGNGANDGGYSVGWAPDLFKVWVQYDTKTKKGSRLNGPSPHPLNAGSTHDIEFWFDNTKRYIKYDNQVLSSAHYGNIATAAGDSVKTTTIHLFDNGVHQMNQNFKGFIYFIKIYENDVLVHNYLPVRENTGLQRVGILDTITKEFFTNASGQGEFDVEEADLSNPCVPVGAGHYRAEPQVVNQGDVGERGDCPKGTYSNNPTATSCEVCPASKYNEVTAATACKNCPSGYNANEIEGKQAQDQCKISCPAGKYLATAKASSCTNVGEGYWSSESVIGYGSTGTSYRHKCSSGLTTIGYGAGADEAGDCGRVLNIGDNILYLRSNKKTTPALNFDINGDGVPDLYGSMSTTTLPMSDGSTRKLMLRYNDQTYYACDESVSGCQ